MGKQELLDLINSLPDDMQALPINVMECAQEASAWERQGVTTDLGSVYQRNVDNEVTLRLHFRTREQGEFLRTYTDPDGSFRNMKRIR